MCEQELTFSSCDDFFLGIQSIFTRNCETKLDSIAFLEQEEVTTDVESSFTVNEGISKTVELKGRKMSEQSAAASPTNARSPIRK